MSRPFGVKKYSYRSGLSWYRRRSINSLSSRCFSRSDKVALVTPVDRRKSSYLLSPSDRSRRISTAQRSPSASSTPAIEHAIPSKLLDRIEVSLQVTPITRVIQLPAPPKLPDRTKNACLPVTLIIRVIKSSSTGDCRNGPAEHETNELSSAVLRQQI